MNFKLLPAVGLAMSVAASPVSADVTVKSKGSATGLMSAGAGDQVQYIKGLKLRNDITSGDGRLSTTVIDMATRQLISIDHNKKEAEIMSMGSIGEAMNKIGVSDVTASITPTGEKRTIAGQACTVHDMNVAIPMNMGGMKMKMVMTGPQCLVKGAPGQADYLAFWTAAVEKGGFLDPNQAKAQPAAAKAMTDMYKKMAELGIPYSSVMNIGMDGEGPMAGMMKKMGSSITNEVTEVSTAAIPDSTFEVPAGYKVKKR
jgi:hypothetical protein